MMGLPLRLFVTAAAAASARRLEEESCFDMVLTDSYADTWDGTTYTITDEDGAAVVTGTMETEAANETDVVCLAPGCYALVVDGGDYLSEKGWTLGALSGGAPYDGAFTAGADGSVADGCAICVDFVMRDSYADTWDGTTYAFASDDGAAVASGTMDAEADNETDAICFPAAGCYALVVDGGDYLSEKSWTLDALSGGAPYDADFSVDADGAVADGCGDGDAEVCVDLVLFDAYADTWDGTTYTITDEDGTAVATGTMETEAANETDVVCLAPGCYALVVDGGDYLSEKSWTLGALSGGAPYDADFSVDADGAVAEDACEAASLSSSTCVTLVLEDEYADGWDGTYYTITEYESGALVVSGTMASGGYEEVEVCVEDDLCHRLHVGWGSFHEEKSWTLGGSVSGGAPHDDEFAVRDGAVVDGCATSAPTETRAPTAAPTATPAPTATAAPTPDLLVVATFDELVAGIATAGRVQLAQAIAVDEEIAVAGNVTVNGNGFSLDGGGRSRFFGVEAGGRLALANVRLVNGYDSSDGGAIHATNGRVELTDVTVENCACGDLGGAIALYDGAALALAGDWALVDNRAPMGGALYAASSTVEAAGGAISRNAAASACGAVMGYKSRLAFDGTTFADNAAGANGGVLCTEYGTENDGVAGAGVFLDDVVAVNNSAAEDGGFSLSDSSTMVVRGGAFSGHAAGGSGGVHAEYWPGSLAVYDSTYANNSAAVDGGVYFCSYSSGVVLFDGVDAAGGAAGDDGGFLKAELSAYGNVTLKGGAFAGGAAGARGGVARVDGAGVLDIVETTLRGGAAGDEGGLLSLADAVLTVRSSTLMGGSANFGAGIHAATAAPLTFDGGVLSGNEARLQGGAVFCASDCAIAATATVFERNAAVEGAAVYLAADVAATATDLDVRANVATFGALFLALGASLDADGVSSSANEAVADGALLYASPDTASVLTNVVSVGDAAGFSGVLYAGPGATLDVSAASFSQSDVGSGVVYGSGAAAVAVADAVFEDNAARGSGGAVFGANFGTFLLENVRASLNAAAERGGAFHFEDTDEVAKRPRVFVANCSCESNAADSGGALSLKGPLDASVVDCAFLGNEAADGGGAAAATAGASFSFVNVTASGNAAGGNGGVARLYGFANGTVADSEIVANGATAHGGVFAVEAGSAILSRGGNVFDGNEAEKGNGGVLYIDAASSFDVEANLTAAFSSGELRLEDSSTNNAAPAGGGGVFFEEAARDLNASDLAAHFAGKVGASADVFYRLAYKVCGAAANGNRAFYGNLCASNVARVAASHRTGVERSGAPTADAVVLEALDGFGQVVRTVGGASTTTLMAWLDNVTAYSGALQHGFGSGVATYAAGALTMTKAPASTVAMRFESSVDDATFFSELPMSLRDCVTGEENQADRRCYECDAGSYSVVAGAPCAECPKHSTCAGGSNVVAKAEFWRSAYDSDETRRCRSGQDKGDSTSLQRECSARARFGNSIHASRPFRETIARPKISRNEWKPAELGAFEVGNFALLSCPGAASRTRARAAWTCGPTARSATATRSARGTTRGLCARSARTATSSTRPRASACSATPAGGPRAGRFFAPSAACSSSSAWRRSARCAASRTWP